VAWDFFRPFHLILIILGLSAPLWSWHMLVLDKELGVYFGLCDLVMQRMTFDSQDFLRLLISQLGSMNSTPVNIKAVIRGLIKAIDSFADNYSGMTNKFYDFQKKVNAFSNEVTEIYEDLQLPESTMFKSRLSLRKWDILERAANEDIDEEMLRYVGAYYSLNINQEKINKNTHQHIFKIISGEKEFLSESAQKDLARTLSRAEKIYSATKNFEETIKGYFYYRQLYANDKQRQSVNDWYTVSSSEFIQLAQKLHAAAVIEFNPHSIAVITSAIVGLPIHLCLQLPVLENYLSDWVLGIDISSGVIKLDLDQIFPGKAKPGDHQALYKEASPILVKPLPKFLHEIFKQLLHQTLQANTVGDLLKLKKVQTKSPEFNENKFINSVARFAIQSCSIDQYEACLIANDFRSIPASKNYYRQTSRQKIWESTSIFYQKIGWGEPVDCESGLSVGSRMVSKDEMIVKMFTDLGEALESMRPSNRANISTLLKFHDQFCAYTATFTIFCLALRNANPIRILSADYDSNRDYLLLDDKHVMGDASKQPVVITSSLSTQLQYWFIHCRSLLLRLRRLQCRDKSFIKMLEGVVDQKNSPMFVMSTLPYSASVAAVAKFWTVPLVENFARHFWESKFSEVGVSARFSSAQLRHQVSGNLNWSGASDLVLIQLVRQISIAQEKVLADLNISPKHGLAKKATS
jgi:hypothetical protein